VAAGAEMVRLMIFNATHICSHCGERGSPRNRYRGSFIVTMILLLLFIVPGLLYELWRLCNPIKVCPACGMPHMIPLDSPRGRELADI
jgi:hypothetical protein